MKISLSPRIFENAVSSGKLPQRGARSRISEIAELNPQTVDKLKTGKFGLQPLDILGCYLSALGHSTNDIAEMKMKDIFDIRD